MSASFKFTWKKAFDAAAIRERLPLRAVVLASRLADHFNTKSGRCDPAADLLAKEMGVDVRTVRRAVADLRDAGWIKTKRGGSDDNLSFELFIPDTMLSGMDDVTEPQNRSSYRTDLASIPDTQCVRTYEKGTRSAPSGLSAPQARSSARVERVSMSQHLTTASS